ncbi:IS66 family insertion sequence element accessory protein TnpB [Methylomusa anaerophila]|uniref:IS66 family insertion sequence element accessory protein TnpB n=1 Tax=Methylomusa anaerophila TaxID=1930071 RepID=UPI000F81A7DF
MFLFCDRRRDRLKALYWEGDGFVLLYKRLESVMFQWPNDTVSPQLILNAQ